MQMGFWMRRIMSQFSVCPSTRNQWTWPNAKIDATKSHGDWFVVEEAGKGVGFLQRLYQLLEQDVNRLQLYIGMQK